VAPQRPPRDTRLDLMRGLLQLQIFASHAHGSLVGTWLITAAWGLSDASEQFVYLSGFALGSVFALKSIRGSFREACGDLVARIRRLHVTHMIVFCGFAAMVIAMEMGVPLPGEAQSLGWGWLIEAPWYALPGAASLLYQPGFMGILPVFLWCMMLLPLAMWGFARIGAWALLPFAALYAAVQLWGWHLPGLGGREIEINPFAWQILFVLGAWFGRRALRQGRAIGVHPWLVAGAALVLVVGAWMRAVGYGLLPGPAFDFGWIMLKQDLAWPRLLHALAIAYIAVVLFRKREVALPNLPMQALAAVGRNSLHVFCIGLFLAYGAATLYRLHPEWQLWLELPLIGGGFVALLAFARLSERQRPRKASGAPA
jgi:hypothetical protein